MSASARQTSVSLGLICEQIANLRSIGPRLRVADVKCVRNGESNGNRERGTMSSALRGSARCVSRTRRRVWDGSLDHTRTETDSPPRETRMDSFLNGKITDAVERKA